MASRVGETLSAGDEEVVLQEQDTAVNGDEEEKNEIKEQDNCATSSHDHDHGNGGDSTTKKESNDTSSSPEETLMELIGPAFGRQSQFWKLVVYSCIFQGIVMGLMGLAFLLGFGELAQLTWKTQEYADALDYDPAVAVGNGTAANNDNDNAIIDILRLGGGPWWYVGLLSAAGLAIGLIKVLWTTLIPFSNFPTQLPGFVDDVKDLKSEDIFLPIPILICSLISIGCGASVGPEAAMGATGTALGTIVGQRWQVGSTKANKYRCPDKNETNHEKEDDDDGGNSTSWLARLLPDFRENQKSCCLDGITAAFGALLPGQFISCMLVFELGSNHFFGPGGHFRYTEAIVRVGISSSVAYGLSTAIKQQTFLETVKLPASAYDLLPDVVHLFQGLLLGILSGVVGFIGFLFLAIGGVLGKKVFSGVSNMFAASGHGDQLATILTPAIGGALVGLLCVASPLILSDGSEQLQAIVLSGPTLGAGNLIASMFIKLVACGVSLGFGFVGGQMFPFLFAGACLGVVVNIWVPGCPLLISFSCCLVAVSIAFVPIIVSFTVLSSMILVLGGPATAPVFLACLASFLTVSGLGLVQSLLLKSQEKKEKNR